MGLIRGRTSRFKLKIDLKGFFKKKKKKIGKEIKVHYVFKPILPHYEIIEEYWVHEPFCKIVIVKLPELGGVTAYYVDEVSLDRDEKIAKDRLVDILSAEISPPETEEKDVIEHVVEEARRLAWKYRWALGKFSESSWAKIIYHVERDLVGLGPINPLVEDPYVEDISCEGIKRPVYVWHRKYESMPTNLVFLDPEFLDNLIIKLAHLGGKHVSTAFPIVDAMIYGKHRFAATFRTEVSPQGSTFTLRKFREEPFSVIDLITLKTLDPTMAAYFWLLLENKISVIVVGGTAAGKTTALNALCTLIKPTMKIVTVEETPELNFPLENWVRFVSRETYGLGTAQATSIELFDLVKTSLRYRPDYLIVGEVRGREAFVLFQALATGHGGMCTLHAESVDAAVKRLTSPPMNVAPSYIPLMNVVALIERVSLPKPVAGLKYGRRVREVNEILGVGEYTRIFEWDPLTDTYKSHLERSHLLEKIAYRQARRKEELIEEIKRREIVLKWMVQKKIRDVNEVAKVINEYYINPDDVYIKACEELGLVLRVPLAKKASSIEEISVEVEEALRRTVESKELDKIGLSILSILAEQGGRVPYGEIYDKIPLTPREFWRYVDTLSRVGYVKIDSVPDETNRLKVFVVLTDEGRRAYKETLKSKGEEKSS
ncbi:protein kinase [Candidatus Geothermarchaeota archaeon]|nr:MAG: protein kinase [Candidatus Geothermarchaeota archaeon]